MIWYRVNSWPHLVGGGCVGVSARPALREKRDLFSSDEERSSHDVAAPSTSPIAPTTNTINSAISSLSTLESFLHRSGPWAWLSGNGACEMWTTDCMVSVTWSQACNLTHSWLKADSIQSTRKKKKPYTLRHISAATGNKNPLNQQQNSNYTCPINIRAHTTEGEWVIPTSIYSSMHWLNDRKYDQTKLNT